MGLRGATLNYVNCEDTIGIDTLCATCKERLICDHVKTKLLILLEQNSVFTTILDVHIWHT